MIATAYLSVGFVSVVKIGSCCLVSQRVATYVMLQQFSAMTNWVLLCLCLHGFCSCSSYFRPIFFSSLFLFLLSFPFSSSGPISKGCCWPVLTINAVDASIGIADGGSIRFYVKSVGGDCADSNIKTRVLPASSIKDGKWHHMAGVYNNSQTFVYLDGVQLLSLQCTSALAMTNSPIRIGVGMADRCVCLFVHVYLQQ